MPRYLIRSPRFIDGRYVFARVDAPAVIEVAAGVQPDAGMELVSGEAAPAAASPAPASAPSPAAEKKRKPPKDDSPL